MEVARANTAGIVLAAGSGARFGTAKQFETLAGVPLLDRAIALLTGLCRPIVLALPPNVESGVSVGAQVLTSTGGATRLQSLARALAQLPEDAEIVVVHDCARPLANRATVTALVDAVCQGADAAVPAWQSPDVVKRRHADGSLTHVGRDDLVIVQSPYACAVARLRTALARFPDVVEETEAIERAGGRVVPVPGDPWSHHVVTRRDLERFERLLGRSEEGPAD